LLPDQQQRIAIACPMNFEATNARPGAKRGEARIVTNEAKLAVTDGAARGSGRSRILLAARHHDLRLALDFSLSAFFFHNPTQSACVLSGARRPSRHLCPVFEEPNCAIAVICVAIVTAIDEVRADFPQVAC
jgi:hypothetical protein